MKLVLISDTHGLHDEVKLPEGDVLIHAGDLTSMGRLPEVRRAANWLNDQHNKFNHVVAIGGNHDFALEHFMTEGEEEMVRRDMFKRVHYLRDNAVVLDGKKFYGSPWQPEFCGWAFNRPRGSRLRRVWAKIPTNTDVLITHGPPMGVRDWVGKERVGCADLRVTVEKVNPKVHVFGHIHGGYGEHFSGGYDYGTHFVNASVVNEAYKVSNAPIEVEI